MKRNLSLTLSLSIMLCTLVILTSAITANAQVSLPSLSPYSQNFDSLASSGTSSILPEGWFFAETLANANATYTAGTGSIATGDTYSFGTTAADRALGSLNSGTLSSTVGAGFINNTGGTIGRLAISYVCEEWRLGTVSRTDRLNFQYSTDATSLSTGTWADFDALDCVTPYTTTTGQRDGNAAANRITVTAVLSNPGVLAVANESTFWIRWTGFDASGADDGLAVDDFSMDEFSPTAVTLTDLSVSTTTSPAPIAFGVLGLTAAALLLHRRRVRSTSN